MASIGSLNWCRLARLKGVLKSVPRLHFSTDVTKTERLVDRVKKFVFGEGAPPESEETTDRFVSLLVLLLAATSSFFMLYS